jgi:Kdo2-lipid IVA lauroyltransferase/acyltransferase
MDLPLYLIARGLLGLIRLMPLRLVARLGRALGWIAYGLDRRHQRVALDNLALAFGREKSQAELHALARENFQRIGENFACAAKTAQMEDADLLKHLEFSGFELVSDDPPRRSWIGAIGHFGNFELFARSRLRTPHYELVTTYRSLAQPRLNRLLQRLRDRSGCLYLERRTDGQLMGQVLRQKNKLLGLLVDQHAGRAGLPVPFFGQVCSTSRAPALLALRHDCGLLVGICYRVALARWRIELGPEIATHEQGRPRSLEAIMADVNQAFETAIRRDPANWFWVHRRWKKRVQPQSQPSSATLPPTSQASPSADHESHLDAS